MSKLKILLLEDDFIQSDALSKMLTAFGYAVVGVAASGEKALKIFREQMPDLALLDIAVKGAMNGIEVGKIINQERKIPMIYLTAYPKKFDDAKATHPAAFFEKPYNERALFNAIDLAIHNFFNPTIKIEEKDNTKVPLNIFFSQDSIWIKPSAGEPRIKILIDDILWVEADNVYIDIYTTVKPTPFKLTFGFSDFVKKADYKLLIQTHRSYSVNIKHVTKFDHTTVFLKDKEIPISKTYLLNVLSALKNL